MNELKRDKTTFEVQQIIYLLIKSGAVDLRKTPETSRQFITNILNEWSEDWKKEFLRNGNSNENPA